mmetsp:Transcript_64881/g.154939  ORF Transcript_64881/g.154939 Transcript_64881/m.154939 type:complete len:205 (+) Transcript_64881:1981-2595(+)
MRESFCTCSASLRQHYLGIVTWLQMTLCTQLSQSGCSLCAPWLIRRRRRWGSTCQWCGCRQEHWQFDALLFMHLLLEMTKWRLIGFSFSACCSFQQQAQALAWRLQKLWFRRACSFSQMHCCRVTRMIVCQKHPMSSSKQLQAESCNTPLLWEGLGWLLQGQMPPPLCHVLLKTRQISRKACRQGCAGALLTASAACSSTLVAV